MNYLVKLLAFFAKEFHDIRRQPRLMLSLVGGPLLVLAAFGATFRSANPFITTVLVWPEKGIAGISKDEAARFIGGSFQLLAVTDDEEAAMRMLDAGQVDVVQVVPEVDLAQGAGKSRPEIRVVSRTIDPNKEAWIRSLAYGETNYINQQLLAREASQAQETARGVVVSLQGYETELGELSRTFDAQSVERAGTLIEELHSLLNGLSEALPPLSGAQANLAPELSAVHRDIDVLRDDLDELEGVLQGGELTARLERLESAVGEIGQLRVTINVFAETPAEEILSPVRETYANLRGSPYPLMVFYAPSVLALLVQQLAVTLAALGVVRERQMGSFELFRVSPLRLSQILLGKSLAYVFFATVAGVVLTGLLTVLKVPLPANVGQYLILLVLLATASVGIGSIISAVSRTDAQAIQLTMLMLLLSVFFTGFFLPITGFMWPAWIIALLIPMTHAIEGLQNALLAGSAISLGTWIGLGLIVLLSYGLVALIMRRQYRKVLD